MKAVVVIDIDDDIKNYGVTVYHYPSRSFVHSMVAILKPLPETKDVGYPNDDYTVGYGDGWDACLKELTK